MNPLQRRCLIASVTLHVFLILIVVFGSAFFVPERKQVLQTRLKMVPSRLVDAALAGGGGNPKVKPSEDREQGQIQIPKPEEPKPVERKVVEPPKPIKRVEPPKPPEPKKVEKPTAPKESKPKESDKLVLKPLSQAEKRKLLASRESRSGPKPAQERAQQVNKAIEELRSGFADGTAVEVHGTGGVAYANYAQMIFEIYDQAWILSRDVGSAEAVTKAEVILERSGRVRSARIIKPSGNDALDLTVQKALNRVKTVPPFPSETEDRERTFIINFNLKAKLLSA